MGRLISWLERLSSWLAYGGCALIFFMMMFVTTDSILRYGLSRATTFGDELVAFMLVATVAAGLAYTFKEGGHLRVEVVYARLPDRIRVPLEAVHVFLALVFSVVFTLMVWRMVLDSWKLGAVGYGVVRIPLWIPQAALGTGLAMLALLLAVYFIRRVRDLRPGRTR